MGDFPSVVLFPNTAGAIGDSLILLSVLPSGQPCIRYRVKPESAGECARCHGDTCCCGEATAQGHKRTNSESGVVGETAELASSASQRPKKKHISKKICNGIGKNCQKTGLARWFIRKRCLPHTPSLSSVALTHIEVEGETPFHTSSSDLHDHTWLMYTHTFNTHTHTHFQHTSPHPPTINK